MSLPAMIAADAANVFLNTLDFAYTCVHRIAGDLANTENVVLLVFWDEDQDQRSGKGSCNSDRAGRRTLHSVLVELPGTIKVTTEKSEFVLPDGTILKALKSTGRDLESGLQTWECNYSDGLGTKKSRVQPQ
jgi:hypothetical protein